MQILSYFPGQKATIFLETVNDNGVRTDSTTTPTVDRVIFPGFTLAAGYPQNMTQLDVGLYYYQFILPVGAVAVGNYLVDVSFTNPTNGGNPSNPYFINNKCYQIIVNAPFGNFSTTIG